MLKYHWSVNMNNNMLSDLLNRLIHVYKLKTHLIMNIYLPAVNRKHNQKYNSS